MNITGSYCRYIFAYMKKAPRKLEDILRSPAMHLQLLQMNLFHEASKATDCKTFTGRATNRSKSFVDDDQFRAAVRHCREQGVPLVL